MDDSHRPRTDCRVRVQPAAAHLSVVLADTHAAGHTVVRARHPTSVRGGGDAAQVVATLTPRVSEPK